MRKLAALLILTLTTYTFSIAQCGFDGQRAKLQQNAEFVKNEIAFENKIQQHIKNGLVNSKSGTVYTIPTVVHVLHKGEAVGVGTNISDEQIESAIDRLNEVYRGLDPSSPIDFEVEFQLAQRDADCNATTGINRVNASGVTGYSANGVFYESAGADEDDLKDLSRWPETDYLNIWVVSEIDGNNGGAGIQGYANFFNGNLREGSVMMASVFGYDPGNTNGWGLNSGGDGGTVVHEFGHYLHLYHTFQGDGTGSTCPDNVGVGVGSDGCADTETHKRHTSTCPTNNDCNSNNPYGLNTRNNYMSYFSCADRLTDDQKTRVRAALLNTSIVSSKGAIAPDPGYSAPVAVCNTNTVTTNNAGIISVELNGVTFSSFSSLSDGGNIDNSANCSNYFEIDASVSNTINVGMFTVNFQQLGVWIDWNDDGDFDDDSEQQHLSQDIAASSTVPVVLDYPASIPYGDYVRVRLITDLDDRYGPGIINSSCYNSLSFGQAEDYTIYVQPEANQPPVVAFSAASTTVCNGSSTVFTDASTNTPTSWSWTFTPSTVTYINSTSSSSQNPEVQFDAAGTYQVQLTATNADGSDDEIKAGYITVSNCATTQLRTSDCGLIMTSYNNYIKCDYVSGATEYEYEFVNIGLGYSQTYVRLNPKYRFVYLHNVPGILDNTTYDVRVRAKVNGSYAPYGSICQVTTPAGLTTQLRSSDCGIAMTSYNNYITCDYVSGATEYEYEFVNIGLGFNQTYVSLNPNYRFVYLHNVLGILDNTTYDVRVRAKVDGSYTSYGSICQVTTPAGLTTQLRPSDCGLIMASYDNYITCDYVSGATEYEYEFVNIGLGFNQTYVSLNPNYRFVYLNNVPGILDNTTYDVRVRVKVDGSYTSYGSSCQITTPSAPALIAQHPNNNYSANESVVNFDEMSVNIYPNPNQGESFNIVLEGASSNTKVYVTDISGKTILYKDLNNENESMNTSLSFDSKLSPGFYMVTVISGTQKVTEKLMVR
ncbi:MAG: T9SS type A sorting domain-containing protein [Vicingus serpentipes]|nr:T9SS type A sorting domain-containing protein [Vicingus serpentipes]